MTKFGSIVCLGIALFVLAPVSSSLRAQGLSINLDLAKFVSGLVDAYNTWRASAHENEVRRRKDSVAILSAHMTRIAATKRSLADFLKDNPLSSGGGCGAVGQVKCNDPEYRKRETNSDIVRRDLEKLDREISGLQDDLDDIDPTWAAKNPELHAQLYGVGHGKGLTWASINRLDVVAFRKWLYDEADALEAAAQEIKKNLPS